METDVSKASTLLLGENSSCSSSFSGFTSFDVEQTIFNKLEGAFFSTRPADTTSTIDFHFPAVFRYFLDILYKEFAGQTATDKDTFTVTSHYNKKTVHITVNKTERKVKVSGPGQKLWFQLHFIKRVALNLYKMLINDSISSEHGDSVTTLPQTSTPLVSHAEPRIYQVPISPVSPLSPGVHGQQQPAQQITALMDMIHFHSQQIGSLRNQLVSLTTEIIQLKEQQVSSQKVATPSQDITQQDVTSIQQISGVSTQPPSNCSTSCSLMSEEIIHPKRKVKSKQKQQLDSSNSKIKNPLPTRPVITQKSNQKQQQGKTLLIGDSLIKNINEKGLKNGVVCYGVSGATVEAIYWRIQIFNLNEFSTVVISVGGNDVANRADPEYFQEKLDQLVSYIKSSIVSCAIVLCEICPRSGCDVTFFNDVIHELTVDHSLLSVPMEKYFNDKDGHQVNRYFFRDGIHFSPSGVRHFLDAIEKNCNFSIVANFKYCAFAHQNRQTAHNYSKNPPRRENKNHKCFKCGETNHSTSDCRHRYKLRCHACGSLGHKQSKCINT